MGDAQSVIDASVAALRAKVHALGAENVAAFFCEPIQGSGGVIVRRGMAQGHARGSRELDILFVVDEVITGSGTGRCSRAKPKACRPLMTVAKGLTAGYVPMARC